MSKSVRKCVVRPFELLVNNGCYEEFFNFICIPFFNEVSVKEAE